jgi:hypothetical protein
MNNLHKKMIDIQVMSNEDKKEAQELVYQTTKE